ncbi:ascorbate peroxidase 6 [Prunus dulcis]|uniref:L-ascorbate peroxidase n=1 Tax=Prunus dulcis TaxID=3755 RepID=A0A4Y1QUF1_PRUDU|nr:ascorbate peroxidase 6 [Prunus dulcis]
MDGINYRTVSLISSTKSSSTFPLNSIFPPNPPQRSIFAPTLSPPPTPLLQEKISSWEEEDWSDISEYELVKEEIRKVVTKGKAAGVLRLVFHDAGTFQVDENSGGMNGSVIYELDRPENKEKAKSEVDTVQPDMISVAGAEAVSICGGPTIQVSLGRLDSKEPDPEGKLPAESLDAFALRQSFQTKGFSTQELVALSGAHTIGNKGFGSPTVFDNTYFKILLEKPSSGSMIGLPSDRALAKDDECLRWITKYAEDQDVFFEDFKKAYVKLVNSGARWKSL